MQDMYNMSLDKFFLIPKTKKKQKQPVNNRLKTD